MPRLASYKICSAVVSVLVAALPYPSQAQLDAPEPAHLGQVTSNGEANTFAYDLLNDPDIAPLPVRFGNQAAYIGLTFTNAEQSSWGYPAIPVDLTMARR